MLFGPNETTTITKKHQNTESTGGGGVTGEANTQHCNTLLKPMCSKKQFWCIFVLRRTDEPTANCTKKQSICAFWCFVEQTKPQQYRKSTKSMKCTTSGGTGEANTQHCDTVLKHICTQEHGTVLFGALWNRRSHSKLNEKARCWCFYVLCWTNETTITTKKQKKARGGDWGNGPVNLHRLYK